MDALPPNDPNQNNNNNNNNNGRIQAKPDPNAEGEGTVDVFGTLHEQPAIAVMFFIGVAAWLLNERCVC
jgi:hypothetical protein